MTQAASDTGRPFLREELCLEFLADQLSPEDLERRKVAMNKLDMAIQELQMRKNSLDSIWGIDNYSNQHFLSLELVASIPAVVDILVELIGQGQRTQVTESESGLQADEAQVTGHNSAGSLNER